MSYVGYWNISFQLSQCGSTLIVLLKLWEPTHLIVAKEHNCCGHEMLKEDVVAQLWKAMIVINRKEEAAIEVV